MTNEIINEINIKIEAIKKYPVQQFDILSKIVREQNLEALNTYLENGFDINIRNLRGENVLFIEEAYLNTAFLELLISKGANINSVNLNNENILFHVARSSKPESLEVMKFLLSMGLNPYNEDLYKNNLFMVNAREKVFTNEFIREYSLFDKPDSSHYDLLFDKNYSLALKNATNDVERVGGIKYLIKNIESDNAAKILMNYYNALILNKRYEEAELIAESFLKEEIEYENLYFGNKILSPLVALMTGNEEVYHSLLLSMNYYVNNKTTAKIMLLYKFIGDTFSNVCPASKEKQYYLNLEWNQVLNSNDDTKFIQPFIAFDFTANKDGLAFQIQNIEDNPLKLRPIQLATSNLLLGMAWFRAGNYVNAEYFFLKVISESPHSKAIENREFEYINAHIMIDYIRKLTA